MKIVIFIDWFSPAYKAGGPIQSIANLVNQDFGDIEFKIICSNKDLDGQQLTGVPYDQWTQFNSHTQVWYSSTNKVLTILKDIVLADADIYFINGIFSFHYNFLPLLFGKSKTKIISARGMLHAGALSQKSGKKKIYLGIWKLLKLHQRNRFHATNKEEADFVRKVFGTEIKVLVAQNLPRVFKKTVDNIKEENSLELISIGLVSPMKNYLEVIKALVNCPFSINYTIYGAIKDPDYWQKCQILIATLPKNIRVIYKGDIPSAAVGQALDMAHVFVLPSKSENFGHAIYEALTAGLPVITSHNTPWNHLQETKAGFNVSLEQSYELSKAICFFASANETVLAQWSDGARQYAEKAINLAEIKDQYRQMFQT